MTQLSRSARIDRIRRDARRQRERALRQREEALRQRKLAREVSMSAAETLRRAIERHGPLGAEPSSVSISRR